ncbi:hypothetical protein QFZ54_000860 [Sphingomonas faeni]|nr:hypothetical protein [Sphingomonas faeni]MDQ0837076.1 hypothetical protein [Sphingomonas faeni]
MFMRPVFMLRATAASLVILTFASTAHARSTPVPEATVGGIDSLPFETAYDALDSEIRSVMAPGKLIVTDDVQGNYPTLRDAMPANAGKHAPTTPSRAIPRWRAARSMSRPTISGPIRDCPAAITSPSPVV